VIKICDRIDAEPLVLTSIRGIAHQEIRERIEKLCKKVLKEKAEAKKNFYQKKESAKETNLDGPHDGPPRRREVTSEKHRSR